MFYSKISGCCSAEHGDVVTQNMGMFWELNLEQYIEKLTETVIG